MRGKPHSPETKAAVTAALLAGQGVNDVAAEYRLDPSVVSRWRTQLGEERLQQVATKKATDYGDLLGCYLGEVLTTLQLQARFFRSEAWLKDQSAAEAGVLHGVLCDKAVRLLEAAELAGSDD